MVIGVAVLAPLFISACATLGWYGQAVSGQLEIFAKREDIAELIADPSTPEDTRRQLALALEIRQFAVDQLDLPDNRSYTHYADLGRDAVVWNVVAAPELGLEPKTWCYPFVGCLAYRGYFRRDRAETLAERLRGDGYDTAVSPVTAYSTLGRFADPVLNTMLALDDHRLAAVLFHELAHQRLFVPGDTAFNEAYATLVEREGVRRWLAHRGEEESLAEWERSLEVSNAFTGLLLEARDRLGSLYASDLEPERMRAEKSRVFDQLRQDYQEFRADHGDRRFDHYMSRELNNAHLALVATYESGTRAFAALLAEYDGDLSRFHRAVEALAAADAERRAHFLDQASP